MEFFFAERTLSAGSSFTSGHAAETVGLGDGVTREEIEAVSTGLLTKLNLLLFLLCSSPYTRRWPCGLHERPSSLGSSLGVIVLCLLATHFTLTVHTLYTRSGSLNPGV